VADAGGRALASAVAALVVSCLVLTGPARAQVLDAATIHDEQTAVVTHTDQIPIQADQRLIAAYQANISRDNQAIADDAATATAAAAAHQAAASHLAMDTQAQSAAVVTLQEAQASVAADRQRLRAIAVGTYTGQLTNPQPSGSPVPEAEQQAAIDVAEVTVVAGIVDRHLRADLDSVLADTKERDHLTELVARDQQDLSATAVAQATATARSATDNATLNADQRGLSDADAALGQAQATLTSDLASLAGPATAPAGSVSLLGGSALNAAQLAAWYHWEGYTDLTPAPIEQLAAWYIQAGKQEGLRGDVAFAQAILETGGFSSPDATDLNNYAGIGHCDSCSSGWQFPSPNGGVIGQIQLLRIFATASPPPAGAPGPVLPSLMVSQQHEAGCCPSVESLTGVWATDPTYGTQILSIYQSILDFALTQR
jgi:hypothetical protein